MMDDKIKTGEEEPLSRTPEDDSTTNRLDRVLREASSDEAVDDFLQREREARRWNSFHEYFNEFIAEHEVDVTEVLKRSGINRNSVYGIVNGQTKNPGRDKVLALSLAAGMDLKQVNRALKVAGHSELYVRSDRDVWLMQCIRKDMQDIGEVNLFLDEKGMKPLDI